MRAIPVISLIFWWTLPCAALAQTTTLGERLTAGDDETFVKPVIQIATPLVGYLPESASNPDLRGRVSTLLLMRFGAEGRLFEHVSFKSVFERNLGFNIGRNGPLGTSVWEGTSSISARENFIDIRRWGASLTAGIFYDPASLDYGSAHILDMFGMDPFVRDPALQSGANLGQGVMARYVVPEGVLEGLGAGLAYTGGNPLISSLSGSFGGDVSASGTLADAPLRDMTSGLPGSNIHINLFSPSVTFDRTFGDVTLGLRGAVQLYFVDADVTQSEDKPLDGINLRASAQLAYQLDEETRFRAFGGYARRGNRQLAVPDLTRYKDDFAARVVSGGADFDYGDFGVGGSVYHVRRLLGDDKVVSTLYANVGASYWVLPESVAAGVRWAYLKNDTQNTTRVYIDAHTLIASLRLSI